VQDIFIAVIDGLKGSAEAAIAVFSETESKRIRSPPSTWGSNLFDSLPTGSRQAGSGQQALGKQKALSLEFLI
jgi:hypothetical protein